MFQYVAPEREILIFVCDPHAALEAQLVAEKVEWNLAEDLDRELELNPVVEVEEPEEFPAGALVGWDAYE